jgi:hypothetical protein
VIPWLDRTPQPEVDMPNGQELTDFQKHVLTQIHELKKAVCALAEEIGVELEICEGDRDPTGTGGGGPGD